MLLYCGLLGAVGFYFRNSVGVARNTMHLLHAVIQTAMAAPAVLRDVAAEEVERQGTYTLTSLHLYLAYILWDTVFYHKTMRPEFAFHHIFTGAAVVHTLCYSPPSTIEVAYRCLSVEASTIFLCLRPMFGKKSFLKELNDLLFFASFSLFRVATMVPLAMFTFRHSGLGLTSFFMATNLGLNAYWYQKLLRKL